jgi:hypothetical protein
MMPAPSTFVGLGLALEFLVVEKQPDQTGGSRGLGHFDETGGLDFDGLVAPEVSGFLDSLDRLDGRRVVRTRLAGHETLGGLKCHHLLDGIELDLFKLGLALGLVVEFTADRPAQQIERCFTQLVSCDHSVDRPYLEGLIAAIFLAGRDPLDRIVNADHPRQPHGTAKAGVDSELDFRQPDLRLARHDPVICSQGKLQPATQRDPIDGDQCRDRQVFEIAEDPIDFQVGSQQFGIGQLEVVNELSNVGTDNEDVLAATDQHALDAVVSLDGRHCVA